MIHTILKTDGSARFGLLKLGHCDVETPVFMPCGTRGVVKSLDVEDLKKLGFDIILGNTYHLFLKPGIEVIDELGGLHKFISWDRNLLTDSGGYQIFSLMKFRKIVEEGINFSSHIDGSKHFMSPEIAIEAQRSLGSDIVMCFDECPPHTYTKKESEISLTRTLRWGKRCKSVILNSHQCLFGIIQGGMFGDLREFSAAKTVEIGFDGYAIGGLSVGEGKECMYEMLKHSLKELPFDKPRYLMGVGDPVDILEGVEMGVDMFDCVMPTRIARHGLLYTYSGKLNIKNLKFERDKNPIERSCKCPVCQKYSRAFLRHLFKVGEHTVSRLLTLHNLFFMNDFMRRIRKAIKMNCFNDFKASFLRSFYSNDVNKT